MRGEVVVIIVDNLEQTRFFKMRVSIVTLVSVKP